MQHKCAWHMQNMLDMRIYALGPNAYYAHIFMHVACILCAYFAYMRNMHNMRKKCVGQRWKYAHICSNMLEMCINMRKMRIICCILCAYMQKRAQSGGPLAPIPFFLLKTHSYSSFNRGKSKKNVKDNRFGKIQRKRQINKPTHPPVAFR